MKIQHTVSLALCMLLCVTFTSSCSGSRPKPESKSTPGTFRRPATPRGPARMVLLSKPLQFQDKMEPFLTSKSFEFELPARPSRARLKLSYSGVPGATSQEYTMGHYRDRVELNGSFLMDLNTHSDSEQQVVQYTKWISVGMLKRHNVLTFSAGDNGARQGTPDNDDFTLRSVVLEFDW